MEQARFDKAATALETSRAHDPELALVYPNLALVYRELQCLSILLTAQTADSAHEVSASSPQAATSGKS